MTSIINPGFVVLHGNQIELLRDVVFDWLQQNPLSPLEQSHFLVQSNGVSEWLKVALAERTGICAATKITLPARFLWDAYREMLGRHLVPQRSAFDQEALTWRLMQLLPELLAQPVFAPLQHFLADGDAGRRLQLAERLADLIDEYQVYRADWLQDWATGNDVLRSAQGSLMALPSDQLWQAQLWRAIIDSLGEAAKTKGRANIHRQFLAAIKSEVPPVGRLPRRVVLFGMSALPFQTLEALAALSTHTQVILAVPNPCQFYWGDIIDGRELLRAERHRQQLRNGKDLAALPLEELHAHTHPLLASWGRLGRDFIRMLDIFDNTESAPRNFPNLRIDLFSEGEGNTLIDQVQTAIRDLLPLTEHPHGPPDPLDRSIEFHVTHSAHREVEVLHEQLLQMFVDQHDQSLRPRDIVVMMPDIETFASSIHAVFEQYGHSDSRYIPYEIADVKDRSVNPLLKALNWLLQLPEQRCRQSEVRDILDVPAISSRFGMDAESLPQLGQWIEGAGVRWGLDNDHRKGLGLGAVGEQNAWWFGIQRMLLGYACGKGESYAHIEPYDEVGGLDAVLAGSLAQLIEKLIRWCVLLAEPASPAQWGERARALLSDFFSATDERDQLTLGQLNSVLQRWLEVCDDAGFSESIPLTVLREAWLGALDEPTLNHRFVSGGVTFCTLMPMRAVPFRVVCLLGMNDGDFPRRTSRLDFDLLAKPGLARPGDRSRRDDDRYLMLEALLAAREKIYISWAGRNVCDNSEQPPSVLVSQLRDYLQAGWDLDLASLTTEHPLQPFNRRYFEPGGLTTYAREWRAAHKEPSAADTALPPFEPDQDFRLTLGELARFIRKPVPTFFRFRLGVVFDEEKVVGEDDESFGFDPLEQYQMARILLDDMGPHGVGQDISYVVERLRKRAASLERAGTLPIGKIGSRWQHRLVEQLTPACQAWVSLCKLYPCAADNLPLEHESSGIPLHDWLDGLRCDDPHTHTVWLTLSASKLTSKGAVRGEKLIDGWLRQITAAALGLEVTGYVVGLDATVQLNPLDREQASVVLNTLLEIWREGMNQPLPTACKTALAFLANGKPWDVYNGGYEVSGEVKDPCLARLWPDFATLSAESTWPDWSTRLYGQLAQWVAIHTSTVFHEVIANKDDAP